MQQHCIHVKLLTLLTWKYCIRRALRPRQRCECWNKEMAASSSNRAEYVYEETNNQQTERLSTTSWRFFSVWHPWSCSEQWDELYPHCTCVKCLFCCESESSRCTVMPSLCSALQSFTQRSLGAGSNHRLAPCTLSCCRHRVKGVTRPPSYAPTTGSVITAGASREKQKLIHAHICVFSRTPSQNWTSKSTGREKRHKSVKTEEATGGGGGDSLQRSATFPGMRGFMMSGGGGREGRAVGFRGRTTVAERRDQSMIVTEAWDWSSTPRSVPRTSYGLNVVSQRNTVTMHLPFVTAARNLE